ncbi:MAG: sensory rhodopsin transducer [Phycisphaerales bacterium]
MLYDHIGFEPLEPRTLLAGTPFPGLELLEDPSNTVIRMETRYGDVDIELLDSVAPSTVAAFLQTLRRGDYAGTFFHYADGERLRGGIDRLDPVSGPTERFTSLAADTPPTRSNQVMTLAMPVLNGQTNPQGTTELVFNLADNAAADNEFAVFGRVVQGWSVILQIAGLPTLDISGYFPGNPIAVELTQVPVTENDPLPPAITQDLIVPIGDMQIIKPGGIDQFYTEKVYYPEGYSWERTFEAIELLNPVSPGGAAAHYQIIVRYETGPRDQVVATGELAPGRRDSAVIAPGFGNPSTIVRNHEPYAYEVWSTAPIAAGFRHKDFKAGVGESFARLESIPVPGDDHVWSFFQAALGFDPQHVFLVWQNTTGTDATVWATFFFEDAEPIQESFFLGGHRRGGLNVKDFPNFPTGATFVGARISADQPIVAAITRYDTRGGGGGNGDVGGITALGIPGLGSTVGITPGAARGVQDPFAILNGGSADAEVTLFITPEGSTTPITRTVTVPASRMLILDGQDNPAELAPSGEFFSLRYASDQPLVAGFITSAFRGTGTPAAVYAARITHFADARAFTAPAGSPFGQQSVSVSNPGSAPATVSLIFRFEDAEPLIAETFTLQPGETLQKKITDYASLLAQHLTGLGSLVRDPYSLSIESDVPIVAQVTQFNSDGRAELGMTLDLWEPLATIV